MLLNIIYIFIVLVVSVESFSKEDILQNIRCQENFCLNVICQKLSSVDCPHGEIVRNASFCNCCDTCISTLDENQRCDFEIEGTLRNIIQPRCKKGMRCINGICTLDKTECTKEKEFRTSLRSNGIFSNTLWVPDCEEDGNYAPKQTKMKRSICVNKDGRRIFGDLQSASQNMTCACSRNYEEIKERDDFLAEPEIHCSSSGDYDVVQCIAEFCFCANPVNGAVRSQIVKTKYLKILPCSKGKIEGSGSPNSKSYLKPCEVEVMRTNKLKSFFQKKGLIIHLTEGVKCNPDGTFQPVQCNPSICACTNNEGVGIVVASVSYFMDREHNPENMTCSCAHDLIVPGLPQLSCTTYGNYKPMHCFNKKCFCVDQDGDLISLELNNSKQSELICQKSVETLIKRVMPDHDITTDDTTQETILDKTDDYDY